MRTGHVLVGVCVAMAMTAGCAQTKYQIVFGESFATTAEAVQEAQNAVNSARQYGYRPISVGGAGAGAATEVGGGLLINIYVLLEGPANAPDLLPAVGTP